jgi:diketogulonate reductase-like aldo/keto reductase
MTKSSSIKDDHKLYPMNIVIDDDDESNNIESRVVIPVLGFGLYKVPNSTEGERIILDAMQVGYRHFDSASIYGNEITVGNAIQRSKSTVRRGDLFIGSKVWNTTQRQGRQAVRTSVLQSIKELQCDGYLDICYVHWPVPGCYIDAYKELQLLHQEGFIRSIGLSNFCIQDYEELMKDTCIHIKPLVNQFEVSPFMYRPKLIQYFQNRGIYVAASKALHRMTTATTVVVDGNDKDNNSATNIVQDIANSRNVSYAQVLLRWGVQKQLIVLSKTSKLDRMKENFDVVRKFHLSTDEMNQLDSLTKENDIRTREELELQRKNE